MAMNTIQALTQLKPLFPADVELYMKPDGNRWEFGYLRPIPELDEIWYATLAFDATIERLVEDVKAEITEKLARIEQDLRIRPQSR